MNLKHQLRFQTSLAPFDQHRQPDRSQLDHPGTQRKQKLRSVAGACLLLAIMIGLYVTPAAGQTRQPTGLPPGQSEYVGAYHTSWANGWKFSNISHTGFGVTTNPPASGQTQEEEFDSTVNARLSMDGGASFVCISAPARVKVRVEHTNDIGGTQFYGTEMLQLDMAGGDLPAGVMVRESPTRQSLGQVTIKPAAGGGSLMTSHFDIWPELSLDGGSTWMPATNAGHMVLTNKSPELLSPTNRLPGLDMKYRSPAGAMVNYCTNGFCCTNGILLRNIVHGRFTTNAPPPPLHSTAVHSFGSQVDFEISLDGGANFSKQYAPANVTVRVSHTRDAENYQFFETEMLQLDLQGGSLPPEIRVRTNPGKPSKGETYIRNAPEGAMLSSSFDLNTELSLDGGVTWTAACCPERMSLDPPRTNDYPTEVVTLNPAWYSRLNETDQVPAQLLALNLGTLSSQANGIYSGGTPGVTGALAGSADTAARFNGAVVVPYTPALGFNGPFTVEAWLKAAATTTGSPCPLSCGTFGANRSGWLIYQNGNSGWNLRMFSGAGANTAVSINAGGAVAPGVWYHVAAVYDGSSTATLYVNGVGTPGTLNAPFRPNMNGPLTLAMRSDGAFSWPGSIDEFAFYPMALPSSEVTFHYQAGTHSPPPVGYDQMVQSRNPMIYLRLDEPALPVAVNSGLLFNINGTYEPLTLPGVPGVPFSFEPNNYGCQFNGSSGYIDIPGDGLDLRGPVTVVAWTKADPANGIFQTIVGKGDTSYRLDMDWNGYPRFADGAANPDVVGPTRIDDGQWHFLAGVYDGSRNSLYLDGLLAGSEAATATIGGNRGDVWIGGAPDYGNARMFHGVVDEVAIFPYALTTEQIQHLFGSAFETVPPLSNYSMQIRPGWNVIANQLSRGGNTLGEVLPSVPADSVFYRWDASVQNYSASIYDADLGGWDNPTLSLAPGEGGFLYNPNPLPFTITFVGEVITPHLPLSLPQDKLVLAARQIPAPATYEEITGLPPAEGVKLYRYDAAFHGDPFSLSNWQAYSFSQGQWTPGTPSAGLGEPVFIEVPTPVQGPVILQQPESQAVAAGTDVAFTVQVTGTAPLSYQWYFNALPITGATNPVLSLMSVQSAQAGEYTVTVSNAGGSVTSNPVQLRLNNPPLFSPIDPLRIHQGESVQQVIPASDRDGNHLTYSVDSRGLQGVQISSTSGLLTWDSTTAAPGSYSLDVDVVDDGFPSLGAHQSIVIAVAPALRIQSITLGHGEVRMTWNSIPGRSYIVQAGDLSRPSANWEYRAVMLADSESTTWTGLPALGTSSAFYTVHALQPITLLPIDKFRSAITMVSGLDLLRILRELNRAKDYDYSQHGGSPGPNSAWLWERIEAIMDELEGRGWTFPPGSNTCTDPTGRTWDVR